MVFILNLHKLVKIYNANRVNAISEANYFIVNVSYNMNVILSCLHKEFIYLKYVKKNVFPIFNIYLNLKILFISLLINLIIHIFYCKT